MKKISGLIAVTALVITAACSKKDSDKGSGGNSWTFNGQRHTADTVVKTNYYVAFRDKDGNELMFTMDTMPKTDMTFELGQMPHEGVYGFGNITVTNKSPEVSGVSGMGEPLTVAVQTDGTYRFRCAGVKLMVMAGPDQEFVGMESFSVDVSE